MVQKYNNEEDEDKKKQKGQSDSGQEPQSYKMKRGYEDMPEKGGPNDGQNIIPEDEMEAIKVSMKLKRMGY
jgi:hypothetical protein